MQRGHVRQPPHANDSTRPRTGGAPRAANHPVVRFYYKGTFLGSYDWLLNRHLNQHAFDLSGPGRVRAPVQACAGAFTAACLRFVCILRRAWRLSCLQPLTPVHTRPRQSVCSASGSRWHSFAHQVSSALPPARTRTTYARALTRYGHTETMRCMCT